MCLHIDVYDCVMARTNLDLDEELVTEAMRRYGLPSRRAAVDYALRRLVGDALTLDEALAMEGSGWVGDLEVLRSGDAAVLG
jgi:Arc/MetJ family transcription regulator